MTIIPQTKAASPLRFVSYFTQWELQRRIIALQENGWLVMPQFSGVPDGFCMRFFRDARAFELFVCNNDSQTAFLPGAEFQKPLKACFDLGVIN